MLGKQLTHIAAVRKGERDDFSAAALPAASTVVTVTAYMPARAVPLIRPVPCLLRLLNTTLFRVLLCGADQFRCRLKIQRPHERHDHLS